MIELYPLMRWMHIGAVTASGILFLIRGLGVQSGQRWPMHALPRYLSYAIDTILLAAALALTAMLPHAIFANGWLAAKLLLVAAYIVLGSLALKRVRTPQGRLVCFAGALTTFAVIVSIARTHDPLGILRVIMP